MQTLFLKDTAVARRYDIARSSVWRWVHEKKIPEPVKLCNGSTRWRIKDLERFEERFDLDDQ